MANPFRKKMHKVAAQREKKLRAQMRSIDARIASLEAEKLDLEAHRLEMMQLVATLVAEFGEASPEARAEALAALRAGGAKSKKLADDLEAAFTRKRLPFVGGVGGVVLMPDGQGRKGPIDEAAPADAGRSDG